MTRRPRLPQLPDPGSKSFGSALKELMESLTGVRGDPIDKVVTFRDLESQAVASRVVQAAGGATASSGTPGRGSVVAPSGVNGLTASGAGRNVVLTWTRPSFSGYALTEIWRSTVNDIGTATQVGSTQSPVYVDTTGGGVSVYYWVRHVSTSGVRGSFSASVSATTAPEFQQVIDAITSTEWQADTTYGLFAPVAPTTPVYVDGSEIRMVAVVAGTSGLTEPDWATEVVAIGDMVVDGSVTWQAYEVGKIPFLIDPVSGVVVIDGASIREASIDALQVRDGFFDSMTAAKGVLGEANISVANIFNILVSNFIASDDYDPGISGWIIQKDGGAEFNNQYLRGLLHNGGLDGFGDPGATTRYIDFRDGGTNGDFVLGDIESLNYISFKYEPAVGERILRIRGDVLLRNYEPGVIPIHSNPAQVNKDIDNTVVLYEEGEENPPGTLVEWENKILGYYVHSSDYDNYALWATAIEALVPTVYAGYWADNKLKSTLVTREGTITVTVTIRGRAEVKHRETDAATDDDAQFRFPVLYVAVEKPDGTYAVIASRVISGMLDSPNSWPTIASGSFFSTVYDVDQSPWRTETIVVDAAVQPNDQIVVFARMAGITLDDTVTAGTLGADVYYGEGLPNIIPFNAVDAGAEDLDLSIGFYTEEQTVL